MIADLKKQGKTDAQITTMLSDAAESGYVATQTQKMVSDRTAQEMLASMILLREENKQALADWRSRSGTVEASRTATKGSIIGSVVGLGSMVEGAMGEAVHAVAPALLPAIGIATDFFRGAGEDIRSMTKGDPMATGRVVAGATAAIGAIKLRDQIPGFSQFKQLISETASAAGTATGLATLADPTASKGDKSMAGASLALIGAADSLKEAAAMLKGDKDVPDILGGGDGGGGQKQN